MQYVFNLTVDIPVMDNWQLSKKGIREKIEREFPSRAASPLASRGSSTAKKVPAAKATRTQPIQFVDILLRYYVTERNKITLLVKQN